MIRSELCKIADMSIPTFNSHSRNGDLPFSTETLEKSDAKGKAWARYSIHEATMLVASRLLSSGQGVTWSEAARIIRQRGQHVHSTGTVSRPKYFLDSGLHCARIEFLTLGGAEPTGMNRFEVYRGFLPDIVTMADRIVERSKVGNDLVSLHVAVFSIVSVNLSLAWQIATARAKSLKIRSDELDSIDFSIDPDGPSVESSAK
jgi:hypothetical protein